MIEYLNNIFHPVARQRHSKYGTIEVKLVTVFTIWFGPRLYSDHRKNSVEKIGGRGSQRASG
jgi:hypothetical protein